MGTIFFYLILKTHAYLNVSAVIFCKQFLAYTVHIDGSVCFLVLSINIQVGLNI